MPERAACLRRQQLPKRTHRLHAPGYRSGENTGRHDRGPHKGRARRSAHGDRVTAAAHQRLDSHVCVVRIYRSAPGNMGTARPPNTTANFPCSPARRLPPAHERRRRARWRRHRSALAVRLTRTGRPRRLSDGTAILHAARSEWLKVGARRGQAEVDGARNSPPDERGLRFHPGHRNLQRVQRRAPRSSASISVTTSSRS